MAQKNIGLLAAVRDGDLSQADAARRLGISRQAFEQQFITFRANQAAQRTTKAIAACSLWLKYCLSIGFKNENLDELERLWWSYHDEDGNFLKISRRWRRHKQPHRYGIRHAGFIVTQTFDTEREAKAWAKWNYKGLGRWSVEKL